MRARGAGEEDRDRALVDGLAEPHAGKCGLPGGRATSAPEGRRGMIDARLVGEDDRLVLMTLDRAFAVDPIQLQKNVKRAVRHVNLLAGAGPAYSRTTNWCDCKGTRANIEPSGARSTETPPELPYR